jgi:hypothetical protein
VILILGEPIWFKIGLLEGFNIDIPSYENVEVLNVLSFTPGLIEVL